MLRELSIENLAVIEKASVEFGGAFNVFTGETGAGKSVIIGGINAVLGGRTNKDIVRSGAPKAVISALFDDISDRVKAKLSELGFSSEDGELVLMREITSEGKSSARINGRAATAAMLREVGELLVDIHGQHENRILMNNDNQRQILDSYGELDGLLEAYRGEFRRFSKLSRKLREMQEENKTRELRTAQLTAIIEELTELDLDYGDGERMEEELQKIRSTAKIQGALFTANNLLNGEENPGAVELVRQSMNSFAAAGAVLPEADALYRRLEELLPELEDISSEAASMAFGADDNEEREADLEDRVSAMKHACRKYNMEPRPACRLPRGVPAGAVAALRAGRRDRAALRGEARACGSGEAHGGGHQRKAPGGLREALSGDMRGAEVPEHAERNADIRCASG